MKKLASILLSCVLFLSLAPVSAWAISGTLQGQVGDPIETIAPALPVKTEAPAETATPLETAVQTDAPIDTDVPADETPKAQPSEDAASPTAELPAQTDDPNFTPNPDASDEPTESETPTEEPVYYAYKRVGRLRPAVRIAGLAVSPNASFRKSESDVEAAKRVSAADENGVYTLTLEAYATGKVTVTTVYQATPCDIVLVLDTSKSMSGAFGSTTRIAALKNAVNNFIDATADDADNYNVSHRIAIVSFNSGASNVTGGFLAAGENRASLKSTVTQLSQGTGTYTHSGLSAAVNIFASDTPPSGERKRVVILFTDGVPGSQANTFNEGFANSAIGYAKTLKASTESGGYGCTVYSVAIYPDADPTAALPDYAADNTMAEKINRFLHYVSYNFPNAASMASGGSGGNSGYYLTAADPGDLNDIFSRIANQVQSGGTTSTLDATGEIRDAIADSFQLATGDAADVSVYTCDYLGRAGNDSAGARLWGAPVPYTSGACTVDAEGQTVLFSGFDFSAQYVADVVDGASGAITGHRGQKLVITVRIVAGDTFGGNSIPTNESSSGVYLSGDTTALEPFPVPTVDLPIAYEADANDRSLYLGDTVDAGTLFQYQLPDGSNNVAVNITYALFAGDTAVASLTVAAGTVFDASQWVSEAGESRLRTPSACSVLRLAITVTSVAQKEENSAIYNEAALALTSLVHVFRPTVSFSDDAVYMGEHADITDNVQQVAWADASHNDAPLPDGDPPSLTFTYDHGDSEIYFAETPITVLSVQAGDADVTAHTVLVADDDYPSAHFVVYVEGCSLTVCKSGAAGTNETFRFLVTRAGDECMAPWSFYVVVHGNDSVTVTTLPIGTYTVTEDAAWSWRYGVTAAKTTVLSEPQPDQTVSFANRIAQPYWLDGDSFLVNLFRLLGAAGE